MTYNDFTNSKNGDMPDALRWLYIFMLKKRGFVTKYNEERSLNDLGYQTIRCYTIVSTTDPSKLEITLDDERGWIRWKITQDRTYNPIYEMGSSKPVEYVPHVPNIIGGNRWDEV